MSENRDAKNDLMRLLIVGRSGTVANTLCTSVRLVTADGVNGRNGGSIGFRKGCPKSLVLLAKGKAEAFDKDKKVFETELSGGFAEICEDTVTVFADE